jgi:hypothetical protein
MSASFDNNGFLLEIEAGMNMQKTYDFHAWTVVQLSTVPRTNKKQNRNKRINE